MSRHEITQRSQFLKNSATLLGSQSPSTSAHLLALHTRILHENFKSLKSREHDKFCGSCGSLRELALTKTTRLTFRSSANREQKVARSRQTALQGGVIIYKCLRCYRRTVKPEGHDFKSTNALRKQDSVLKSPKLITDTKILSPDQQLAISEPDKTLKTSTMDNANSKKRAKTRKQGGLKALLVAKQQNQSTRESSSSLDLLDFLRQ
jgi:hypothetical protein